MPLLIVHDQNSQLKVFIEVRACSAADLQACTRLALVCGLPESCFQDVRHCSMVDLYCARATSGTLLETQASYFAIKSSHSGTPILVLLFAVAGGEEVVVGINSAALLVPGSGSDLAQLNINRADTTHSERTNCFRIL